MSNDYLIVSKKILPKYYDKAIEAKKLLQNGKVENVSEACKKCDISRSTFYKYKDYVFSYEKSESRKLVFSLLLAHRPGALSKVCSLLSDMDISILTLSQAIPVGDIASITISCDISKAKCSIDELEKVFNKNKDINKFEILAFEG